MTEDKEKEKTLDSGEDYGKFNQHAILDTGYRTSRKWEIGKKQIK